MHTQSEYNCHYNVLGAGEASQLKCRVCIEIGQQVALVGAQYQAWNPAQIGNAISEQQVHCATVLVRRLANFLQHGISMVLHS